MVPFLLANAYGTLAHSLFNGVAEKNLINASPTFPNEPAAPSFAIQFRWMDCPLLVSHLPFPAVAAFVGPQRTAVL